MLRQEGDITCSLPTVEMNLKKLEDYEDLVIKICPNETEGEVVEVGDLLIMLPKQPDLKDIAGHDDKVQVWRRSEMPEELSRIKVWTSGQKCLKSSELGLDPTLSRSLSGEGRGIGL